ncbi:MAG: PUA domain-containing protein [Promethearchaeota archaeon]
MRNISYELLSSFKEFESNLYISVNESISHNKFPRIYLILDDFKEFLKIPNIRNNICSGGLYVGYIKKGKFLISIESVEFLYRHDKFLEFHRIFVNEMGERSILYGNDIIMSMILNSPSSFNKNDLILIFNDKDEILALAKAQVNFKDIQNLKPKSKIASNLVDKGYYLRQKQ